MTGLFSLAKLMAFVIVAVEAAARVGAGSLPLFRKSPYGALERFGLGLLLGWMFVGTAYLGLALTGLFRPALLLGLPLVLLVMSRPVRERKLLACEAARESGFLGGYGLLLIGLACLPVVARMLTFENESTSYYYHLGAPWHYLLAGRALLENMPYAFHFPMPADLSFALSLVIGDDRASKWQVASFLAAAGAVYTGGALRRGGRDSAWLGMLLILTTGHVMAMLGTSKNDLAATALFIAGIVVVREGGWTLGSLLLGSCLAAKLTCAPAVAVWLLFLRPPAGRRLVVAAGLALPVAPWLVKTALATGDPVFPLASSFLPSYDWGWMNDRVADSILQNVFRGSYGLFGVPGMWLGEMGREFMPVLLLLPGLLLFGPRRPALASLLALLVTFGIRHDGRYLLPAAGMACLVVAEELGRGRDRFRRAVMLLLVGYCLTSGTVGAARAGFRWRDLLVGGNDLAGRSLPYQEPALRWLRENGCRRAVSIGEMRTYLFPCRLLHGGMEGETPLVWKTVSEARNAAEIAKRFRQLGADCIVYNFIGVEWFAMGYRVFPWDTPMARRYVEYCRLYEVPAYRTETSDFQHGGYIIYRLLRDPSRNPSASILVAPGMDHLYGEGIVARLAGRYREAVRLLAVNRMAAPEVGISATQIGLAAHALGDYQLAFREVGPWIGKGGVDAYNLLVYGSAAMHLGRNEIAETALQECLVRYPDQHPSIHMDLAMIRVARAMARIRAGSFAAAADAVREGEEFIAMTPESGIPEKVRRQTLAGLKSLRAQLAFQCGDMKGAAGFLREALKVNPEDENAPNWRVILGQIEPPAR